jgi:hypothetical protein
MPRRRNLPPFITLYPKTIMFVDRSNYKRKDGTIYIHYLLRQSRREGKKIIKTTLLNITSWGSDVCEALAMTLKNKKSLPSLVKNFSPVSLSPSISPSDCSSPFLPEITQGKSVGAVWLLYFLAQQIGLVDAFGSSRDGHLALWQVIARILDQGSRFSATRLARSHEIDFLELGNFDEDSLYKNLDWLAQNQSDIETTLYKKRYDQSPCSLFLYDVTSSYFE